MIRLLIVRFFWRWLLSVNYNIVFHLDNIVVLQFDYFLERKYWIHHLVLFHAMDLPTHFSFESIKIVHVWLLELFLWFLVFVQVKTLPFLLVLHKSKFTLIAVLRINITSNHHWQSVLKSFVFELIKLFNFISDWLVAIFLHFLRQFIHKLVTACFTSVELNKGFHGATKLCQLCLRCLSNLIRFQNFLQFLYSDFFALNSRFLISFHFLFRVLNVSCIHFKW